MAAGGYRTDRWRGDVAAAVGDLAAGVNSTPRKARNVPMWSKK